MAAGYFYVIIGITLMAVFKKISAGVSFPDWIVLQSYIMFVIALLFIAAGYVMAANRGISLKTVHIGIWGYIGFMLADGVTALMVFGISAGVFGFWGCVGSSILIAFFSFPTGEIYLKKKVTV